MANALLGLCLALTAALWPALAAAADASVAPRFLRIATGTTSGTYFPVGTMIANAISNPPGTPGCAQGGSCGVPGLIAVAATSQGAVENVRNLLRGGVETALVQADVAFWAYTGRQLFARGPKGEELRAIASLYPETLHVVVRRDAGIESIAKLRGKRVSLGPRESGSAVDARLVLGAHGLKEGDIKAEYLSPAASADRMRAGELDALFMVGGHPVPAIAGLAEGLPLDILPVEGVEAQKLIDGNPFFTPTVIPGHTYRNVGDRITLSVSALWVTSAKLDDELVYQMTVALWHPASQSALRHGHPTGRLIRLDTALDGVAIPLHDGAQRFYREAGRLPE